MPTWGEIHSELTASAATHGSPDFDGVRRGYLQQLHSVTGRDVILYATAWFESRPIPPTELQVGLPDIQGFMEAVSNLEGSELDLIIHSPGGSAEAAESIVSYLRQQFKHIRVIVPVAAMSAATMIALAADEIVMGKHSQLGPIDPQFNISTPEGIRAAPAKAILKQFELAKEECKNQENVAAWMPILRTYAPGLLAQCQDSQALAFEMVAGWLKEYMFAGDPDGNEKATAIATRFADYEVFLSHGRRVGREQIRPLGVKVVDLESDKSLQDAVLSVHHATMHTFGLSTVAKIVENHRGRAWISMVTPPPMSVAVETPAPAPPADPAPGGSRAARRRQRQSGSL